MLGYAIAEGGSGRYLEPAFVISALSFLASPFGLPKAAIWLIAKLHGLNELIKEI
jgi:hypothetical protein